ncbi:MAG: hypothetical protein ACKOD2_11900 [Ilumatobacteraceae bacterium]
MRREIRKASSERLHAGYYSSGAGKCWPTAPTREFTEAAGVPDTRTVNGSDRAQEGGRKINHGFGA